MDLPVEQIMSQLQGGADVEEDDSDDEEDGGELAQIIKDTELELIGGDQEGCLWLVINGVHICYMRKDRGTKTTTAWKCSGRRRLGCQFKIRTTNPEDSDVLSIVNMSSPEIHVCSQDKVPALSRSFA